MSELCRLRQSERCEACDDVMPGLPKVPAAEKIDVDADGKSSDLLYQKCRPAIVQDGAFLHS